MDRKYIEENEIEIKYLRNQLSPEELEEFEVYLMENPEVLELLSTTDALQHQLTSTARHRDKPPFLWFFSNRIVQFSFSSLLLGLFLGTFFQFGKSDSFRGSTVGSTNQIVYLSGTRSLSGGVDDEVIAAIFPQSSFRDSSLDQLVLALDTGNSGGVKNRATIKSHIHSRDRSDQPEELGQYTSDPFGIVIIVLPVSTLKAGSYLIELESEQGSTKEYHFEIFAQK